MAIKLKGSKKVGIICIILLVSSILVGGYAILDIKFNGYYLDKDNYTETIEFKNIMAEYVEAITNSYIRYGESKSSDKFNEVTENDLKAKRAEYEEKYTQGKEELNKALNNGYIIHNDSDVNYEVMGIGNVKGYFDGLDKLEATYKIDDENLKKVILDERRIQYNSYETCIEQYKNLQYVLYENDNVVKTNIEEEYLYDSSLKDIISSSQFYLILDGTKIGNLFQNVKGTFSPDYFIYYTKSYEDIKNYKLKFMLFVPKDLYYDDMIKIYSNKFTMQHDKFKKECIVIAIAAFISLVSFAYIIKFRKKVFTKSNNAYKEKLTYRLYKKLWLEIKILNILIIVVMSIIIYEFIKGILLYSSEDLIIPSILMLYYMFLTLGLSYVTLIKEIDEKGLKNVIKETSLLYKFYLLIKETFIIRSVGGRIAVFSVATIVFIFDIMVTSVIINTNYIYNVIAFSVILLGGVYVFLYMGTVAYIGFKFTGSFNKIVLGAHKISQGNLNYQIEGSSIAVLDVLAKDINNMRSGLGNAIQNEVKSERMKTELITNVSHDLKTPLTSIINYVDLIKKGDFSKEEIEDYIKIIDRKSQRLKVLIDDLFEASSAASGEMELNIEKLDIVALLKQSIAEFEEKIKISRLDFRINMPNEKVYVMVDGKRTWRIFENQISNILKYSLDNTRVYINLEEREDRIIIIFKNISAYEIDFNEDEITERFKRGDQSRHTEGSGLGLAISKGLTELQDGIFKIKVDGDLFKVEIQLKKA